MASYAELFIRMTPTEKGGRSTSIFPRKDDLKPYRPHLKPTANQELLGVVFVDGPAELRPGEEAQVTAELVYSVDYSSLKKDSDFDVLEGNRVVAQGKVLERYEA